MLSTENPPPDPPCSSSENILKSDGNCIRCDEKVCVDDDDNQVVDLLNCGLDDKIPLPKFSIRDYVFSRRGKDIETHWPFSPKNLQLCLKHGVKNVLPPFQTLYSLRNPSTVKCAVKSITDSHVKLSSLSNDHDLPISSNVVGQNLASNTQHIKLSGPEEVKEYSSTTKNKSCSDLTIKTRYLEQKSQNPVKKCKLIVKLNNVVETKSKEEASLNVSETMASKVCPVCKTFSSSSNTTLNAHIDQCLCGESTAKCTTESKVVKHRIKPRKTKLMVDIYETALHCTLEDLDRRNGTNWASNLSFPPRDLAEEKEKAFSSECKNEESAVYVDSNGTKLRILSKFNEALSTSSGKDDCGSRKLVEREKGNKFVSSKKKKHLVHKHSLLNLPHGQRTCSSKSDSRLEVNNGEQTKFPPEKSQEKVDPTQALKDCDKMKTDDFGMIKPWVGSKRTGLKKKVNTERGSQHMGKVVKNLKLKGYLRSQGEKFITVPSDENPVLSIETRERKDNAHGEYMEQSRLRKRAGISLSESRGFNGKKNRMVNEHYTNSPKGTENDTLSQSSKKKRVSIGSNLNADKSLISSRGGEFTPLKKTSFDPTILSEGKKFSSLKKNLLSESQKNLGRKRKLYYMSESDDEAFQIKKRYDKSMINKNRVLKIRKKDGVFVNSAKEGEFALKGSEKSPESNDHGVKINFDSLTVPAGTSNVHDAEKEVETHGEFVCEPTTNVANGEAFVTFSKSLDTQFVVLGEDLEIDANEGQGNYFVDVDPIPIPGPPGSFLPSPGRMGSEELQGNSSLTTCRLHSSEDEHELVDMDSSGSPISTTSNVSINRVAEKSILFEAIEKVDDGPRANSVFSKMSPPRVENSQPCCCSRKEGGVKIGYLTYQDSQLLRRRALTSLPLVDQTREPEKVIANSSTGYCESTPSPSTPNPILRLMGKNLMVVNQEENLPSPQNKPTNYNHSFHHTFSRGPPVFDNIVGQHFGFGSIHDNNNSFRAQELLMPNKGFGGNFGSPFEFQECGGWLDSTRVVRGEKARGQPVKEIIVIDDSPENENTRREVVSPIYGYPAQYYPIGSGSHQMVPPPSIGGPSMNFVKWNGTGEGSRTPHANSLYFSHGFP